MVIINLLPGNHKFATVNLLPGNISLKLGVTKSACLPFCCQHSALSAIVFIKMFN